MPETLFFLFSSQSPACKQLSPTVQNLSNFLTIIPIDIDHPDVRQKISLTDIKTVPCIVVQTDDKIMVLENHELTNFLHRIIGMVQASQQQAPSPPQQQVQATSLVNPAEPLKQDMSFTASVNSRLQPVEFAVEQPEVKQSFDSMMIEPQDSAVSDQGYSKKDILGGAGETQKELKSANVKSASESMMREREELESHTRKNQVV